MEVQLHNYLEATVLTLLVYKQFLKVSDSLSTKETNQISFSDHLIALDGTGNFYSIKISCKHFGQL
jgi:hypothetical protein